MQGNIDFTGSLSGSISGGGGGGSDVTITPTLQSGTKIADYEIDGDEGALYAPKGISQAQQPLLILGDVISIDLSNYYDKVDIDYTLEHSYQKKLYAYTPLQITGNDYNEISLTFDINDYASKNYVQSNYQPTLTAGNNISIENNVISATGMGGINYSTAEQDTGLLWYDGSHIYQKTFTKQLSGYTTTIDISDLNISKAWIKDGFYDIGVTCISLNEWMSTNAFSYAHINTGLNPPYIDLGCKFGNNATVYITIQYIKNPST